MILNVIETILGVVLFNISSESLKNSVKRKWREGFIITLITSIITITHGLLAITTPISDSLNSLIFFLISSSLMIGIFRISKIK